MTPEEREWKKDYAKLVDQQSGLAVLYQNIGWKIEASLSRYYAAINQLAIDELRDGVPRGKRHLWPSPAFLIAKGYLARRADPKRSQREAGNVMDDTMGRVRSGSAA